MKLFTSLSAVDRQCAEAYAKLLLSIVMSHDFTYSEKFLRKMTGWMVQSEPFRKRFSMDDKPLKTAHKLLLAKKDPNKDDTLQEAIYDVVQEIKAIKPQMGQETDLRKEDLDFFNYVRLYHEKGSENAFKNIHKSVSRFLDPDINKMFVAEQEDKATETTSLQKLVRKHTGKDGYALPIPLLQEWQAHKKETGKEIKDHTLYKQLRAAMNKAFKSRLQSIVRQSGKPYLPTHEVIEILDREKIPHTIPEGFVGMVDDLGKYYTTAGKKLAQIPSGTVIMNPLYRPEKDNAYVCRYKMDGAKEFARAYTAEKKGGNRSDRFDVVVDTLPKLPSLAKKWRAHMKEPETKDGKFATLLELFYVSSGRASNKNAQSKGEQTFGITQLRVKHIKITPNTLIITYVGKAGKKHIHKIEYASTPVLKRMVDNIKSYTKGKKPNDLVFSYKKAGVDTAFTSTTVSRYMQRIGFPQKFTIHKIRTARATRLTSSILKKCPFEAGGNWKESELNAWVKQALVKVAEVLGHSSGEKANPNTAIGNYIEPGLFEKFYKERKVVRIPAVIQKAIDDARKDK